MRAFGQNGAAAVSTSLPAPVGGWNTRDALADMPADHAVIMDNVFPGTDRIDVRNGSVTHATGAGAPVETLLEYVETDGAGELFAAAGDSIFDVTTLGAVSTAVVDTLANARWQQTMIGTAGGQFLLAMNGADTPITYDGTTWDVFGATGPTIANLIWCNLHQRRLWFGEEGSLSAWYLAVNSITGVASEFPLYGVAKLGGYIMAMGTWTRDAGDGQDDVAVFLTSEGEAIVYQGTDPADAATWALIGVWRIGKPIGRRCMIKLGADLLIITQDGYVPASKILLAGQARTDTVALSAQINKAVNIEVQAHGALFGWQPILYPRGTMLLVNVPQSTTTAYQHVFNTLTGAPGRFLALEALCWGMLNDDLYFGTAAGTVVKADTGTADNGLDISYDVLQAFNYFKMPARSKSFRRVNPIFQSNSSPNVALDLNVDFQIAAPTAVASAAPVDSAQWGIARWGIDKWGGAGKIYEGWRGVRGHGRAAALRVRGSSSTSSVAWIATHFLFVPGGMV